MQFDNQKTRSVADAVAKILAGESVKSQPEMLEEELKGNQHKIDANKNNKIDAHDFKLLRSKKKVEEETEELEEATPTKQEVKQGIGIARDKRYAKGNVTGAVSAMDKVNKGLAQHPVVKKELRKQNEEVELTESHFKVGDEVVCKKSGMEGEVVKVDEPQVGKYYTVKQENGKMVKYAPDELKKEEEDEDEDEKEDMKESAISKSKVEKFHMNLDNLVHKTFGHSPAEKKEKMKKEEKELDETMFPGTKEYEKKFGQSPQQKLKKVGDTEKTAQGEMKKTTKGVMHTRRFSEMISVYKEGGLKTISEMFIKEESDSEEFAKEVEDQKAKMDGKKKGADVAKASVQAVKVEEETDLQERSLTEPEAKKKEEIVKSMKKKLSGFKQRYGDRAKEVMYATATKIAKEKE